MLTSNNGGNAHRRTTVILVFEYDHRVFWREELCSSGVPGLFQPEIACAVVGLLGRFWRADERVPVPVLDADGLAAVRQPHTRSSPPR